MKSIEEWKLEYEQDDFCGTTFETPKGGVLTVVGHNKLTGNKKRYYCHCSICHKDEDLFPELETIEKYWLVKQHSVPCACSKAYHWNDRQYRLKLKNDDYQVISQKEIKRNKQKVKLECIYYGHEWEATVDNLLRGKGCPRCAAIKSGDSMRNGDPLTPVLTRCSELAIKFHDFVGEYKNNSARLNLECHCGNKWKPSYNSFINNKCGCPACAKTGYNNDKAGIFYVVHWHKADKEFLKYGITNKGEKRITGQHSKTDYTPTILYFPEFSDGNVAAELERECHIRRNELYGFKGVVSKEEFEDGYTETMNVDQWDWINNLVFETTMTRLKPI